MEYEFWLQTVASAILMLFGGWMPLGAVRNRNRSIYCFRLFLYGCVYFNVCTYNGKPITIVAFSGFAAQHAIKDLNLVIISSIVLFSGSFAIQIPLSLFGSALKRHISNPSVIFYFNFLIIGMGLRKVL
jgi:hypothetical protein